MKAKGKKALVNAWGLIEDVLELVTSVHEDLEREYSGKSERWQEGDKGQKMQEQISALEELRSSIEDCCSTIDGLVGGE